MSEVKEVSVNAKFKIKVGATELELSKDDAEKLYSALFMALGKKLDVITMPYIIKEIEKYPYYPYQPYKWETQPIWKYEPNTILCSTGTYSVDGKVNNFTTYLASNDVGVSIIE